MKKVTIQDIANELNLSRNTVSKALKNSDKVSYETKYNVVKKANELGYSKLPSTLLNLFKIKEKDDDVKTIIVLARREISPFWNSIVMGIADELKETGNKLQLYFVSDEEERDNILPIDLDKDITGIIILSVFSKEYIDEIKKHKIPIVFLDAPVDISSIAYDYDVIIPEGEKSIEIITKDLIAKGCKRIGFIGDITYCKSINDRFKGYLKALNDANIPVDNTIIATYHTEHKFYVTEEVEKALDGFAYIPDAIVCANDNIALDVVRYLKDKGISVPDDVAVTGYDDLESMAKVIEPYLTTVRVGNQRLGRRLVQQLMWRIENPAFPTEVTFIYTEVIFRKSSEKIIHNHHADAFN